jgi:hypothetical protein
MVTFFFLSCDMLEYGCCRLRVLVISSCRWNMGLLLPDIVGQLKVGVEVKTRKAQAALVYIYGTSRQIKQQRQQPMSRKPARNNMTIHVVTTIEVISNKKPKTPHTRNSYSRVCKVDEVI